MYIITKRSKKEEIISELINYGTVAIDYIYCMGSYEKQNLFNILGFMHDKEKVLITGLNSKKHSDTIIEVLNEKYHFKKSNSGIAFTIPVEKVSY